VVLGKADLLLGDQLHVPLVSEIEPPRSDCAPLQLFVLDVDARGRVQRIYAVLASHKLKRLDVTCLRGPGPVLEAIVRGVRFVLTKLQRPEQRLSKHIQVHARSRVRPRVDG
jgi:hypothetical protein